MTTALDSSANTPETAGGALTVEPALPRRRLAPSTVAGIAAVLFAIAPSLVEIYRTLATAGHHVSQWGDDAVFELATRNAIHGHQLLGPYSRFGWNHPGPALFYWLALPVWLLGPDGPGYLLGGALLELVVIAAIVAFVWRRAGSLAALWTAGCVGVFTLAITPAFLRRPWGADAVVLLMVLVVLLFADGAVGRGTSLAWAFVVGSFTVQSHISTATPVGMVALASLAVFTVRWWRTRRSEREESAEPARGEDERAARWARLWVAAAGVAFVGLWTPPLLDVVRDRPSNIQLLWRFFTAPHPTHTLHDAAVASLSAVTILPFGQMGPDAQHARTRGELLVGLVVLVLLAGLALALGWWRRQPLASGLAVGALIAFGVGVVTTTRVLDNPILSYLVAWQSSVTLILLIAVGVGLLAGDRPWRDRGAPWRVARPVLLLGAVAISIVTMSDTAREVPAGRTSEPFVQALGRLVTAHLGPSDRNVRVTIASHDIWPFAAGVVLELDREGRHTTVAGTTEDWTFLFGKRKAPTGREVVDVEMYLLSDANGRATAQGEQIGTDGDLAVNLRRLGP